MIIDAEAAMTETMRGRCHCGAVAFEFELRNGADLRRYDLRRCNCSLCRRKGAIMVAVPLDALRVTRGADHLGLYQWNTRVAKHYFCRTCGIYTHHARRSNPEEYGVNLGCIDGVDPHAFDPVPVGDGRTMSTATISGDAADRE